MTETIAAIRLNTIGQLIEHGYAARLDCAPCGRGADVDLDSLCRQLGAHFPLPEIRKHATCPHCGGAVSLAMRLAKAGPKPAGHPMAIRIKPTSPRR
jgi:hypothetical protein